MSLIFSIIAAPIGLIIAITGALFSYRFTKQEFNFGFFLGSLAVFLFGVMLLMFVYREWFLGKT
jgi:hypothetical protein